VEPAGAVAGAAARQENEMDRPVISNEAKRFFILCLSSIEGGVVVDVSMITF